MSGRANCSDSRNVQVGVEAVGVALLLRRNTEGVEVARLVLNLTLGELAVGEELRDLDRRI